MPPQNAPTKEQFEAAARRVMETAPEGLTKEQFFDLVDSQLAGTNFKSSLPAGTHGYQDYGDTYTGPTSKLGGFMGSLKDQVLNATVHNPALQGAAKPQGLGDILGLVIPDANVAGAAIQGAIKNGPRYIERAGEALSNAGRATRGWGLPAGMAELALGNSKTGAAVMAAPLAAEGAGHVVQGTGKILGREMFAAPSQVAPSQVDRYMPNVSSATRSAGSAAAPVAEAADDVASQVDRYMPNSGGDVVQGAASAPNLKGVPYSQPNPIKPAAEVGRLTGNKAPSTDDVLADALSEALGPEKPTQVSGPPSALSQTATGRPAVTQQRYDEIVPPADPHQARLDALNAQSDKVLQDMHDAIPTDATGNKIYNPGGSQEPDFQAFLDELEKQYPGESRITPETPAGTPDAGAVDGGPNMAPDFDTHEEFLNHYNQILAEQPQNTALHDALDSLGEYINSGGTDADVLDSMRAVVEERAGVSRPPSAQALEYQHGFMGPGDPKPMIPDEVNGIKVSKDPAPEGYDLDANGGFLPDGTLSREGVESAFQYDPEMREKYGYTPDATQLEDQFKLEDGTPISQATHEVNQQSEAWKQDLIKEYTDAADHLDRNGGDSSEIRSLLDELKDPDISQPDTIGEIEGELYARRDEAFGGSGGDEWKGLPPEQSWGNRQIEQNTPKVSPSRRRKPSQFGPAMQQDPNWHSGTEPGSADAKSAEYFHRLDAQNKERLQHLWFLDELGDK